MANEIRTFYRSGSNLYAVIRNTSCQVWYIAGQVFEAWGTGGRDADDYDITLTDKSGSMFLGNFDSNIPAGYYYIMTYNKSGANPADADYLLSTEYGYWTGSAWRRISEILESILAAGTGGDTINITHESTFIARNDE